MYVSVSVCPPPGLLITSGVMWHDMGPKCLVEKFYRFYMTAIYIIGIVSRCVVLALMRIVETNLIRVSKLLLSLYSHFKGF